MLSLAFKFHLRTCLGHNTQSPCRKPTVALARSRNSWEAVFVSVRVRCFICNLECENVGLWNWRSGASSSQMCRFLPGLCSISGVEKLNGKMVSE